MEEQEVVKGKLLACGKHYTFEKPEGAPCSKCSHFASLASNKKYQRGLQYNGTPWAAIFEPVQTPAN